MSSRIDRGLKQSKEKHQTVLNDLLREEANRYCADCKAKGPRWASWNLGVFVCIRCAGIHRNLGVHISRVKSVNLDSWTPEQMESIQKWGNKRAADYYEFYLPDDFARPHGDSAMETLIRNKYERKLYIRKGGEPPANKEVIKEAKVPQQKKREKQPDPKPVAPKESKVERKPQPQQPNPAAIPRPHGNNNNVVKPSEPKPVIDLLGMGDPAPEPVKPVQPNMAAVDNNDEFDLFMQAPISSAQTVQTGPGSQQQQQVDPLPTATGEPLLLQEATSAPTNTIESIMSLYQSGSQQQKPMYGVPGGVYLPQQQQQGVNQPMMGQQARQNTPQMNQQQGMQIYPPRMNMGQSQIGTNQTGQRFSAQGMVMNGASSGFARPPHNMGMTQANMGMTQANMGMSQTNMGMSRPNMGMTQPNMGISQPNMGMSQPNMGMSQQNMGMSNNQQMMPNMMMMQNQMQNMNLGQRNQMQSMNQSFNQNNQMMPGSRHQYMTNDFQSNLGQSIMTNSYGANRPMMPSQQPILANGPPMGLASANMGTSPTMGHTLSNQLWN